MAGKDRLRGKVAIISGAAAGIGAAAATLFAAEGATVWAVDERQPSPEALADSAGATTWRQVDVADEAQVSALFQAVVSQCGQIDVVYNNAGIGLIGVTHETSAAEWDRVLAVNLRSVFLMCKYALPTMMAQRAGAILNTASGIGVVGSRSHHAYGASKAGIVALTRSIAVAYGQYNIRANCLCPGPIETAMLAAWSRDGPASAREHAVRSIPLGRLGTPEDVAYAALFLASDEAAFISGAILPVDGGSLA